MSPSDEPHDGEAGALRPRSAGEPILTADLSLMLGATLMTRTFALVLALVLAAGFLMSGGTEALAQMPGHVTGMS
jgi:hypothetical protein